MLKELTRAEACSFPEAPAVTGGGLEWRVEERGKVENVRGREEEKMSRAELQAKRELVCLQRSLCNRVG